VGERVLSLTSVPLPVVWRCIAWACVAWAAAWDSAAVTTWPARWSSGLVAVTDSLATLRTILGMSESAAKKALREARAAGLLEHFARSARGQR
jgi:hypothetical protein